jgi:hypothetical protein
MITYVPPHKRFRANAHPDLNNCHVYRNKDNVLIAEDSKGRRYIFLEGKWVDML